MSDAEASSFNAFSQSSLGAFIASAIDDSRAFAAPPDQSGNPVPSIDCVLAAFETPRFFWTFYGGGVASYDLKYWFLKLGESANPSVTLTTLTRIVRWDDTFGGPGPVDRARLLWGDPSSVGGPNISLDASGNPLDFLDNSGNLITWSNSGSFSGQDWSPSPDPLYPWLNDPRAWPECWSDPIGGAGLRHATYWDAETDSGTQQLTFQTDIVDDYLARAVPEEYLGAGPPSEADIEHDPLLASSSPGIPRLRNLGTGPTLTPATTVSLPFAGGVVTWAGSYIASNTRTFLDDAVGSVDESPIAATINAPTSISVSMPGASAAESRRITFQIGRAIFDRFVTYRALVLTSISPGAIVITQGQTTPLEFFGEGIAAADLAQVSPAGLGTWTTLTNTGYLLDTRLETEVPDTLAAGLYDVRLVQGGQVAALSGALTVTLSSAPPAVTIVSPLPLSANPIGVPITLIGTAIDPEDGDISGSIQWLDASQGPFSPPIATGANTTWTPTVAGPFILAAVATDSSGMSGGAFVNIFIV